MIVKHELLRDESLAKAEPVLRFAVEKVQAELANLASELSHWKKCPINKGGALRQVWINLNLPARYLTFFPAPGTFFKMCKKTYRTEAVLEAQDSSPGAGVEPCVYLRFRFFKKDAEKAFHEMGFYYIGEMAMCLPHIYEG